MTAEELARRAGVDGGQLRQWLNGRRSPRVSFVVRVLDSLGVTPSVADLIERPQAPAPSDRSRSDS